MRRAILISLAVLGGLGGLGGVPTVDADDGLEQRVATLEATAACQSGVAPFGMAQLHHSVKRVLVVTQSGQDTLDHPTRYQWVVMLDPACVKELTR